MVKDEYKVKYTINCNNPRKHWHLWNNHSKKSSVTNRSIFWSVNILFGLKFSEKSLEEFYPKVTLLEQLDHHPLKDIYRIWARLHTPFLTNYFKIGEEK